MSRPMNFRPDDGYERCRKRKYFTTLCDPRDQMWRSSSPLSESMTITTLNVAILKKVKNDVIGNPSAKLSIARDEVFVSTSVTHQCCR